MRILFVCVGNSCRSQMAEGFARHYAAGLHEIMSAGTRPASHVAHKAVEVMAEKGIDISHQKPKAIDASLMKEAKVISMGCGVESGCPANLYSQMEECGIEDPMGKGLDKYREVRDIIEGKVKELLKGLA